MSIDLPTLTSRLAITLERVLATISAPDVGSPEPLGRAPAARLILGDSRDPFLLPDVRWRSWAPVDSPGIQEEEPR